MRFRKASALPEDLRGIDATLRELRPELPEERSRLLAARARASAYSSRHHTKEPFLRSRLAIILMLVLGFAFSSTGVGLALTGVGNQDTTPADVQYPVERPVVDEDNDVGLEPVAEPDGAAPVQEHRQVAAEHADAQLPFTGFASVPVMLIGVVLVMAGLMLRRRGRRVA